MFGLFLCKLDIRQESVKHTEALDAITTYLGLGSYKCGPAQRRLSVAVRPLNPAMPAMQGMGRGASHGVLGERAHRQAAAAAA